MIRPLTQKERTTLNLEQPGARVTASLAAENNRYRNLRESHIRRLALQAQGLAAFHALHDNVALLQAELDQFLQEVEV